MRKPKSVAECKGVNPRFYNKWNSAKKLADVPTDTGHRPPII